MAPNSIYAQAGDPAGRRIDAGSVGQEGDEFKFLILILGRSFCAQAATRLQRLFSNAAGNIGAVMTIIEIQGVTRNSEADQ